MAIGKEKDSGEYDDRVRIRLGSSENMRTIETYSFRSSILQQPAQFSLSISGAKGAREVLQYYPPGPEGRCQLYIGSKAQFTGELDAVNARGDAASTMVDLRGRDLTARLFDTDIVGERSFDNVTYEQLFRAALEDCGLSGKTIDHSNTANRIARAATKIRVRGEATTSAEIKQFPTGVPNKFKNVVTAKMGESWLSFLERQFSKLGLFIWCTADGNFVLSRPNGSQEPTYSFFRRRGEGKAASNVEKVSFTNDTTHRFSSVVVFARNLGKKYGHNHQSGKFEDEEMKALGFNRRKVYRDVEAANAEEAAYFARKQIAEINRASWKLQYVVSGHTAPVYGKDSERAILVPDTIAWVDDQEIGIREPLYIESVEYHSPPRVSIVTMMRPYDLVFGEIQAKENAPKAKAKARRLLSFVRNRDPISFVRDKPNENTNVHRAAVTTVTRPSRPEPPPPPPSFGPAGNK